MKSPAARAVPELLPRKEKLLSLNLSIDATARVAASSMESTGFLCTVDTTFFVVADVSYSLSVSNNAW